MTGAIAEKGYETDSSIIGEDQSQKKKTITIWPLFQWQSCKCHYTCESVGWKLWRMG